ncbi:CRTAC1 family protein [Gemmata sp. JC717]|uniref:CRTAC1 family protein n=1 Tax=Gemmata algarum TaxID=2975278 RepID=UPI0021BB5F21|nr:CRTAC1 family protein [Gemmata algarum]MDY3552970.1 CRTAC1 family protein [Gemmata algarum]
MFEDVSHLIADNPPGFHYGAAVADLDRGRLSFVVAGFAGPNRVLSWSGGALRDAAPAELADPDGPAVGVAAGDLDGDGREELYVLNCDSFSGAKAVADRLFKRGPDGTWEDLFDWPANRATRNLSSGRSVAVLDRRGVGRYGFFVASHGRPMRLYELNPAGTLVDLAPALGLARTGGGRGALALPLFGPHVDLFCANERGPNFAFRNLGGGTFEELAAPLRLRDCEEHARGLTAFDAGGEFGLAWGNWDGPHRLMARAGDHWKDFATPGFAFPSAVRTVLAADFDNDGNDEIFMNHLCEPNRVFRVASGWAQPESGPAPGVTMLDAGAALDPDGYGTGAAVADIDGDGVLELLVSRGEKAAQPLGVFKARAAHPNWLRVRPLTRFGAPARGAVVRAEYAGRVRVKGICGGSGYLCQMEPVAHFGLGDVTAAERVTVTWPDGTAVVLLNPGGNRVLTVPYPRG